MRSRGTRPRNARGRLSLEWLEARVVPSTLAEIEPNNDLPSATALALTEDPASSGFFTAHGSGALDANDNDYWSFGARAGDRVSVAADGGQYCTSAYVVLYTASGSYLRDAHGYYDGHAQITNFAIPSDGTYYATVRTYCGGSSTLDPYHLRVTLSRGFLAEQETNNSTGEASAINLAPGAAGHAVGAVSGNVTTAADVDLFHLGRLAAGDVVNLNLVKPSDSTLDPQVRLIRGSNGVQTPLGSPLAAGDLYYAQVGAATGASAGTHATYLLHVDITDNTSPSVVSSSLPTPPLAGQALDFDGVNDFVEVPSTPALNPTTAITLEAWVRPDSDNAGYAEHGIAGTWDDLTGNRRTYRLTLEGNYPAFYVSHVGSDYDAAYGSYLEPGRWYHLAGTFDGSTIRLYINGVLDDDEDYPGVIATNARPFTIGRTDSWGPDPDYFNGGIDEVRVWNVARDEVQIQADMRRRLAGTEPGLAGYWRFDEGSGTTAADQSANANTGTLGGAVGATARPQWTADAASLRADTGTATVSAAVDHATLFFSEDMAAGTLLQAANYSLREAGPDGLFSPPGTGDDVVIAVTPTLPDDTPGTRRVDVAFAVSPLQPGLYRFETSSGLTDRAGRGAVPFQHEFRIVQPVAGRIESLSNDTLFTATPLTLTEMPPLGSRVYTGLAVGSYASDDDQDYWRFTAEASDRLTVRLEVLDSAYNYPTLYLYNAAGSYITSGTGSNGYREIQNFTITTPGTYYLYTYSGYDPAGYEMRVDLSRRPDLEVETNNDQASATPVALSSPAGGRLQGAVAGALAGGDATGDYFRLGTFNTGNLINLTLTVPSFGALAVGDVTLGLELEGSNIAVALSTSGELFYQATQPGVYYARVQSPKRALRAQYLLGVNITDGVGPTVTGTSFPAEGSTTTAALDRFSVTFSEDPHPAFKVLGNSSLTYNGHTYVVTPGNMTWTQAEAYAQSIGGHLVTINDAAENAFIYRTFTGYADVWIGLRYDGSQMSWVDGDPAAYRNFNPGYPSSPSFYNYTYLNYYTEGRWYNTSNTYEIRGVVELSGADADGDGLVDTFDPYPADARNGFELRGDGADNTFDTADDVSYSLASVNYVSGATATFRATDGPLQPDRYRLMVTTSIADRAGNALAAPFVRTFTIDPLPGFTLENRDNDVAATATLLTLTEDPAGSGLRSAAGRGNLTSSEDRDYWSFDGTAGDTFLLAAESPGNVPSSGLYYTITRPDGSYLTGVAGNFSGQALSSPIVLTSTGRYTIRVERNYSYLGEYRFRVSLVAPSLPLEREGNDSRGTATALALTSPAAQTVTGRVTGFVASLDGGDHFALGTLAAGNVLTLSLSKPSTSGLSGILTIYDAAGTAVATSAAGDATLTYTVATTGAHVVRITAATGTANVLAQYLLGVSLSDAVAPTVTTTTLPAEGTTTTAEMDRLTVTFSEELNGRLNRLGYTTVNFGGHTYMLVESYMPWSEARSLAQSLGGYLVTVNDAAENTFIKDTLAQPRSINFWTGLRYDTGASQFLWANGDPSSYRNYASGYPVTPYTTYPAVYFYYGDGLWRNTSDGSSIYPLIEFDGPDSDGDGLVDSADAFPTDAANGFELRSDGADNSFGTGDDEVFPLAAVGFTGGAAITLRATTGPLPPDTYRFTALASLSDRAGNPLAAPFVRTFTVADLVPYVLESRSNDTTATATPLTLTEDPAGSGIRSAFGRGNLAYDVDFDYWSFTATAGERLVVVTESPGNLSSSGLTFEIYKPDGSSLITTSGNFDGTNEMAPFALPSTGLYKLRVRRSYNYTGEYRFRVSTFAATQAVETENNNSTGSANLFPLARTATPSQVAGQIAGYVRGTDTGGDYFALGSLNAGATITLGLTKPATSSLSPILTIYNGAGTAVRTSTAGDTSLTYTIPTNAGDRYFVRVSAAPGTAGATAQYLLSVTLDDAVAPTVVSVTLPPDGSSTTAETDRFTITFSEDLDPILARLNYQLALAAGRTYALLPPTQTWTSAESLAQALGGHLATVNDATENALLFNTFVAPTGTSAWIGLNYNGSQFVWADGDPSAYRNFQSGYPFSPSSNPFVYLWTNGAWLNTSSGSTLNGIAEFVGADDDADGLVNPFDPFPTDTANGFDLRAAGLDDTFDTADDVTYRLGTVNYTGGTTATLRALDGPLQPGRYRLTVTPSLRDRAGNALAAPFVQTFTLGDLPPFTLENRSNETAATATPLPLTEDPTGSGLRSAFARGNIAHANDVDYYSFDGTAGDTLLVAVQSAVAGSSRGLYYEVRKPDGSLLTSLYANFNGQGDSTPVVLPVSTDAVNKYTLVVRRYYDYFGEYQVRISHYRAPLVAAAESSSVSDAIGMPFTRSGNTLSGRLAKYLAVTDSSGDFYRLGTLGAGTQVALNLTLPATSNLSAVLAIVNGSGTVVSQSATGATSHTFTVPANGGGAYYARVTAAGNTGGVRAQYLLDVSLTDAAAPVVTAVNLPADGTTTTALFNQVVVTLNEDPDTRFTSLAQIVLHNGHAYFLTSRAMTWLEAQAEAVARGGHLVSVNDATENEFLRTTYSAGLGTIWIGLADDAVEGTFSWRNGDPLTYTNWNTGEPNNSGNEDFVGMLSGGRWNDHVGTQSYFGVIEIGGPDGDADGIPDSVDPYPTDPLNAIELRGDGADGAFDTGDDVVYTLVATGYIAGPTVTFNVANGPLQPDRYRLTLTTSLADRFGNQMAAPRVQTFTFNDLAGYVVENRDNNTIATATPLNLVEDPAGIGLRVAGGRGALVSSSDRDYFSFNGTAGDTLSVAAENPGRPSASGLYYEIYKPDGNYLTAFYADYTGTGQNTPIVLPNTGQYTIVVSPYYTYTGEYRLVVATIASSVQVEAEDNGDIDDANTVTLATSGDTRFGSVAGHIATPGDLDYYHLGLVNAGQTINLNVRRPASSPLPAVVSVYNAANGYMTEVDSEAVLDGMAQVNIRATGTYYAVVRTDSSTAGPFDRYVLDVQVVPTATLDAPNLQVFTVTAPASGAQSGQEVTFSYTVKNVGTRVTPVATWADRVVLSLDTTLGNADDIFVGVFNHTGTLAPNDTYSVTQTTRLPEGISGSYYVLVETDTTNQVDEFLNEGDNVRASAAPFTVTLAPYPDLRVENLALSGPNGDGTYTVNWQTWNRGDRDVTSGWRERVLLQNRDTLQFVQEVVRDFSGPLLAGGMLSNSVNLTVTHGNYRVLVITDALDQLYEFTTGGHVVAEQNNTATDDSLVVPNRAPAATNDTYTTLVGQTLNVAAPGVLGNDSDADNDPITAVKLSDPASGTLTFNANGSFTYIPATGFVGTVTFTYKATDGSLDSNSATVTITVSGTGNTPPVAVDDGPYSTNEDVPLTINAPGVVGNDTDADNNPLTAVLVSGPVNGTLVLNANGSFTYTPSANFAGNVSFTYRAHDGQASSANTATVTIQVGAVNDAPSFTPGANQTVAEDAGAQSEAGWATGISAGPADEAGQTLSFVVSVDNTSLFSVPPAIAPNGTLTYTPAPNVSGTATVTVRLQDNGGTANGGQDTSAAQTFTITITPVNDGPTAGNDAYSTDEDTPLTVAAAGVLANDTDPENDALTAVLVSGPANGTLVLNANGSFTYTPGNNFHGSDSFTYKAHDGGLFSNVATVILTVRSVNDAPVSGNNAYTITEDTTRTVAAPGVLGDDTDADGDPLTAVLVSGPANGTLVLNANGSFTYTPRNNFHGSDSFTYKAHDGATHGNVATVTLTVVPVNDVPVAANDSYTTDEDQPLTVAAPGVRGNDTDADGDALTVSLVSGPANGTLVLSANGSFTYTPRNNFHGSDSFTYKANDGQADSNVATVSLTVLPVNDAPTAGVDAFSTPEDTLLVVAAPGLLANDGDVDGDAITAHLLSDPAHGTLVLNEDGSFTYTPEANFHGTDSFIYKAHDGAADSSPVTVTITVTAVNDAPEASPNSFTTDEDAPLSVPAPGVLAGDTDTEGDALTAVLVSGPANGTLTLNADGSFLYTPRNNFHGSDSFTYQARDGQANSNVATVTLTVRAVNDAPTANHDAYGIPEDATLSVPAPGVLANDADVEGTALTVALVSGPAHGTLVLSADGSFTYTPSSNFNGSDSFTYRVNDGQADSNLATVTILVGAANDAPTASNDSFATPEDTLLVVAAPGVLAGDTDTDGEALTAVLVSGPAHGTLTLNVDGSFTYMPAEQFHGSDSFTYQARDGQANSNVATVTIAVGAVNDAPTANPDTFAVAEEATLSVPAPGVLANDTDVEGDGLTVVLVSGPAHGTLVLHVSGAFTYTPAANFSGSDSYTYKATDGQADSNVATVTLTVGPVNDLPVAAGDGYSTDEDVPLIVAAPGVLANDSDLDSPTLTAVLVGAPAHGTLVLNPNGSFSYTPEANFHGTDSFSYQAHDGAALGNVVSVAITVHPVNDAPEVEGSDSRSVPEGSTITFPVTARDVDDTTGLVFSLDNPPAGATIDPGTGIVRWTPAVAPGTYTITVRVTDGGGLADVQTFTIVVTDAPLTPIGLRLTGLAGVAFTGVVARFADGNPNSLPDQFTATVNWGTRLATGTIARSGDGFTVSDTNTFPAEGTFTLVVTITELGRSSITARTEIQVLPGSVDPTLIQRQVATEGQREVTVRITTPTSTPGTVVERLVEATLVRNPNRPIDPERPPTVIVAPVTGSGTPSDPTQPPAPTGPGRPGQVLGFAVGEDLAAPGTPTTGNQVAPLEAVASYEIRVQNLSEEDLLVVTLNYPDDVENLPVVGFLTPEGWRRVRGSAQLLPELYRRLGADRVNELLASGAAVLDTERNLFLLLRDPETGARVNEVYIVLDATSRPALLELNGTVFTVAVPQATPRSTVTVSQPVAANQTLVAGLTRTATFTSSTQLTLSLTASQNSQLSVSRTVGNLSRNRPTDTSSTDSGGGDLENRARDVELWRMLLSDEEMFWLWLNGHGDAPPARPAPKPMPQDAAPPAPNGQQNGGAPAQASDLEASAPAPTPSAQVVPGTQPLASTPAEAASLAGDTAGRSTDPAWAVAAAVAGLGTVGVRPPAPQEPKRRGLLARLLGMFRGER